MVLSTTAAGTINQMARGLVSFLTRSASEAAPAALPLTGESLPASRKPGDAVFSGSIIRRGEIGALVYATGGKTYFGKPAAWLSAQFYNVMVKAGIVEARGHESTGKGRDARRDTSRVSFHSLRYNTTSALKSSGVSDSVAMDIVGHETTSVSRNYTKIDDTAKRAAINKLPDITK